MDADRQIDRRVFLRRGLAATGGVVALPVFATEAMAQSSGSGPYGAIDGVAADANGIVLPEGFTSRVIAVGGDIVEGTDYQWHVFPDGAATFPDGDGGWYYTCNSEVFIPDKGGVSALHFTADGEIVDGYSILSGSVANCAGGPTPWGMWLSCEEDPAEKGLVWECDPTGAAEAVAHPAMGRFAHEAVAVDPENEQLYLTEDEADGLLYRYTPSSYPDLSAGVLEAGTVGDDGTMTWSEVPDPSAASAATRTQVPGATVFSGGEGIWHFDGYVYFTTKGDNVVHSIELATQRYTEVYRAVPDDVIAGTAPLYGVDNITVDGGTGDLFVAEDGGQMRISVITPDGTVAPFLRVEGHESSEITGPVFNPARDRLYFSSQRGPSTLAVGEVLDGVDADSRNAGITYEISGPFRGIEVAEATTTTVQSPVTTLANANDQTDDDGDGGGSGPVIAVGVGAAVAVAAAAMVQRRKSNPPQE